MDPNELTRIESLLEKGHRHADEMRTSRRVDAGVIPSRFEPMDTRLWSVNVTGQVATGAAVVDGRLFVQTQARTVYAFR